MGLSIQMPSPTELTRSQRITEALERYWLPLGLAFYILANFLPLTGKATNNVFYVLGALPTLLWVFLNPRRVVDALRDFSLFWVFLLVYAIWGALHPHFVSPKPVLYIALLFLGLLAIWRPDGRPQDHLFAWLACLSLLALMWTSFLWYQGWREQGIAPRIVLWADHNPLRTSMLICASLVWYWLFQVEPRLQKHGPVARLLGLLTVFVLLAWCAVVFQARSALLGVAGFLVLLLLTRRAPRLNILVPALAAVVLLGWWLGWHEVLIERGLSYRMDIWQDAWQRLSGACGLWAGCGNDDYLFLEQFTHPHSAYWSILYSHGAVVFLLFLLCALTWLIQGLRYRSRWLLVAAIGWGGVLTTTGGVIHSPSPYWIYFWMPTIWAMLECRDAARRLS